MTPEEIQRERVWLDGQCRHLMDIESRNLIDTAGFDLVLLGDAAAGAELRRGVEAVEAEYARCKAELEKRIERRPPPTRLPEHLFTGEFVPVIRSRRSRSPRVISKFDVFAPRRGRR